MRTQRAFLLNPRAQYREALKITHPPVEAARQTFVIEPMRFIPHDGIACHVCSRSSSSECVNNGEPDGR